MKNNMNRRSFLKVSMLGVAAATVARHVLSPGEALANQWAGFRSPPPAGKKVADPATTGKRLNYVHKKAEYKGPKVAKADASSNCANCLHFKLAAGSKDAWAPCAMLSMNLVYEDGMCQMWTKKP